MNAQVYTLQGVTKDTIELADSVFSSPVNDALMAQAVRVFLANQRQGNAHTKGRGDVTGSTRKIYKQKGTGNARHGDIKAPVFVGGGIVHGPQAHDFTMSFPVKMKRAALRSALSASVQSLAVVRGLLSVEAKTKTVVSGLKSVVDVAKKPLLVLAPGMDTVLVALRNSDSIDYVSALDLNTYEVLNHDRLIIAEEALEVLTTRLGK